MKNTKVKVLVSNEYGNNYSVSGVVISEVYTRVVTSISPIHRSGSSYPNTGSSEYVVVKLDSGEIVRDVPLDMIAGTISFDDLLARYIDDWGDL